MATRKIDTMADVKQEPAATFLNSTGKPAKKPAAKKEKIFRTNIQSTQALWNDFRDLAHLRGTNPNALLNDLIRKEVDANAALLKKYRALATEATKEG